MYKSVIAAIVLAALAAPSLAAPSTTGPRASFYKRTDAPSTTAANGPANPTPLNLMDFPPAATPTSYPSPTGHHQPSATPAASLSTPTSYPPPPMPMPTFAHHATPTRSPPRARPCGLAHANKRIKLSKDQYHTMLELLLDFIHQLRRHKGSRLRRELESGNITARDIMANIAQMEKPPRKWSDGPDERMQPSLVSLD